MRLIKATTTLLFFMFTTSLMAQQKGLITKTYYPKDSILFEKDTDFSFSDRYLYGEKDFGKTTMIIRTESYMGVFYFVFKKRTNKTEHNLYAFVFVEDHGGLLEKARFQDFGNVVYTPEFDYPHCSISDEDKDGSPEFYLAYMGNSDGLDAKPYKQIIYTIPEKPKGKSLIKSKTTAFYPAGNEGDVYHIEYDDNWKKLPKAVKEKSNRILKEHAKSY